MKQYVLLNPGPACTSINVKQAMVECGDVCPRETETGDLMEYASLNIKKILTSNADDYEAILFTSSGTGAVESVISSLPKDANVLNLINGSYGLRIKDMLSIYNIPHLSYNFNEGALNYDTIKNILTSNEFTHITVVHCETTTGIINDIKAIGRLAKDANCKLVVDAMSSAFAYPIDADKDGIDFLCCSSNKLVQGIAGIGIVLVKKSEIENCHPRTVYLDIKSQYQYFQNTRQMRFTPPVQIINALKVAIDELKVEGILNRYKRYEELNRIIRKGMEDLGFKALVNEEENSVVITSFIEPADFDFEDFHDFLKHKGFVIYPGKVSLQKTFRISNIGDINNSQIIEFLNHVKYWVLEKPKYGYGL